MICTLNFQNYFHITTYKYVLNLVVKIFNDVCSVAYIDYYAIILGGVFRGHGVYTVSGKKVNP